MDMVSAYGLLIAGVLVLTLVAAGTGCSRSSTLAARCGTPSMSVTGTSSSQLKAVWTALSRTSRIERDFAPVAHRPSGGF